MNLKIGTCSWNYDSWVGLVYNRKCSSPIQYLNEYSKQYKTVEIDSWFYALPRADVVQQYLEQVDNDFLFTCKVTNSVTLTHLRDKSKSRNDRFLHSGVFNNYIDLITPMLPQITGIMLEFEYLNRDKMGSLSQFLKELETFFKQISSDLPVAVETRNKNYLQKEYFELLKAYGIIHVFSEKLYMPHIYEIYGKFGDLLSGSSIIRLLGGDRKKIEKATQKKWDSIVEPKEDIAEIAAMVNDMLSRTMNVTISVNNHYEGSAPLTIRKLVSFFD